MKERRHLAWPGPMYWDHRCLICSRAVDDPATHRRWWQFR